MTLLEIFQICSCIILWILILFNAYLLNKEATRLAVLDDLKRRLQTLIDNPAVKIKIEKTIRDKE